MGDFILLLDNAACDLGDLINSEELFDLPGADDLCEILYVTLFALRIAHFDAVHLKKEV